MTVDDFVATLTRDRWYADYITHMREIPARDPVYGELSAPLPDPIQAYLDRRGIQLYSHQCETIEKLRDGKDIVLTTSTASGKTLAFCLPVFERLYDEPTATALYLYPAKPLSNDQLKAIQEIEVGTGIVLNASTYDADVDTKERQRVRRESRLILSNPYMLHQTLSHHRRAWAEFFSHLRFIVIDEAHTYRGISGSNMAHLLRRVWRICDLYGSHPQFILSTATIANPMEFAQTLTGRTFDLVNNDGSPRGKKTFMMYNPYAKRKRRDGDGAKVPQETITAVLHLCLESVAHGLQTIGFTRSRSQAESLTKWAKVEVGNALMAGVGAMPTMTEHRAQWVPGFRGLRADSVSSYQAGYDSSVRHKIERDLKRGAIRCIFSTNALEMGVDIGGLDTTVICGYPGSIMSTWQQSGRSGRTNASSVTILVAGNMVIDQYYMRYPQKFFASDAEHAVIDLWNDYIVKAHLCAAAAEIPITVADQKYYGDALDGMIRELYSERKLVPVLDGWEYGGSKDRASLEVEMGGVSSEDYRLLCQRDEVCDEYGKPVPRKDEVVEVLSQAQAFQALFPGAVRYNRGSTYVVQSFDRETHTARAVKRNDLNYYTIPIMDTTITVLTIDDSKSVGGVDVFYGEIEVTTIYSGFIRQLVDGGGRLDGVISIPNHAFTYRTQSVWISVPTAYVQADETGRTHDLGGMKNALLNVMPLFLLSDKNDVRGQAFAFHPLTEQPTIFLFDAYEGGCGLSKKAYDLMDGLLTAAIASIAECTCDEGCPLCIYSGYERGNNETLVKSQVMRLASAVRKELEQNPVGSAQ